jgi:hypothetical protein
MGFHNAEATHRNEMIAPSSKKRASLKMRRFIANGSILPPGW